MFQVARALFVAFLFGTAFLGFLIRSPRLFPTIYTPLLVGILLVVALLEALAWWLRSYLTRRQHGVSPPHWNVFTKQLASTLLTGAVVFLFVPTLIAVGSRILNLIEDPASRIYTYPGVSALFVFLLGLFLFAIRRRLRCLYGLVEVGVGVVVALRQTSDVVAIGQAIDGRFMLAMLTASVYLVVRGLDNVDQGIKSTPKDPVAQLLQSLTESKRPIALASIETRPGEDRGSIELNDPEFQCVHCKAWSPSPIAFATIDAFETSKVSGISTTCRYCSQQCLCTKDNLRFTRKTKVSD